MKKLMCAFVLAGALAGCGKERFSDPQKFVEHYGQELLGEYFKSGMELMSYKGFEFSNAKVGFDRNGRECVSALVSLIVPHGEDYYRRVESPSTSGILKTWPSEKLSLVAGQEVSLPINTAYREAREGGCAPVVYSTSPVDIKKLVSPWKMIRIIRIKDGEGVYHPAGDIRHAVQWYAADGDEMSRYENAPTEPFYTGANGLLSGKAIKRLCAVRDGTPEAVQARESYVKRLEEIETAIKRLNDCCVTQSEVLAVVPRYVSTNSLPNWIWERRTKESSNVREMVADAENKASRRNREVQDAVRNAKNALGRLNSQVARAEQAVLRAKKNLEADTKQLERNTAVAAKTRRPSKGTNAKIEQLRERVATSGPKAVSDAEASLADLKAKVQSAEAALAEAKSNQARIVEEGQSAIAKAKADGEKTLSHVEERLKGEYEALKQKSSAELNAAVEDCKRLLGLTSASAN